MALNKYFIYHYFMSAKMKLNLQSTSASQTSAWDKIAKGKEKQKNSLFTIILSFSVFFVAWV
jgi:hypothetical protein